MSFLELEGKTFLVVGAANKKSVAWPFMKRFGTGQDVAHCVLFLASRASTYITGAVLETTGGI